MSYNFDNKGFSVVGVMMALFTLTCLGYTAVYTVVVAEQGKVSAWSRTQSSYIADAGVEYALRQYYSSQSSVAISSPGKSFGGGAFTIGESGATVTVTGFYGDTMRQVQFDKPSQSKCTPFDTSSANLDGSDTIHHIYFERVCLALTVIDKIRLSWTNPGAETLQKVRIENNYVYDNSPGASSGDLVELSNFTIDSSNEDTISKIEFSPGANLVGKTFTLIVYLGDGTSTEPLVFTPP